MSYLATHKIKHLTHFFDGSKLSASEKGILMQLADDHNEDRGCAWPSIPKLAVRVGLGEKQCRRLVQKLEQKKMIESRPRLREHNEARTSNEYRFWFDPQFDRASTRATNQRLQLQAQRSAQRATQMHFSPPPAEGRGTLPPKGVSPGHPRPSPPPTEGRGPLPSEGGQDHLEEPLGELSLDLGSDHKRNPLPPVGQGASLDPVDQDRFNSLKLQLKSDLCSTSPRLAKAKGFAEIIPGQNDYDSCFVEWFLRRVERKADGLVLFTEANNHDLTKSGLKKYEKRLAQAAWLRFGFGPMRPVKIVLL